CCIEGTTRRRCDSAEHAQCTSCVWAQRHKYSEWAAFTIRHKYSEWALVS
ncbi:hypothetical protein T492DRAFT_907007, partial [Pavlovales sp. CCMP2436]